MKAEREKVILITGGAGGLGSVMAAVLASEGLCVYLLDLPQVKERADILLQKLTEEGGRGRVLLPDRFLVLRTRQFRRGCNIKSHNGNGESVKYFSNVVYCIRCFF